MSLASHQVARPSTAAVDPLARTVVKAFNTWAYKREQPSDLDLLHRTVAGSVSLGRPIPFVLYWGKGPRSTIAGPDRQCLDFLASVAERVGDVYAPGAQLTLLLTDTHARLNNHPAAAIDSYFADIAAAAAERTIASRRLSDVVAALPAADRAHRPSADAACDAMLPQLVQCAAKWYGGPGDAASGARRYLDLNIVEKRAVEVEYPHAVFITFNGRDFRGLFPDALPIVYMYSLKKGTAVKPWFIAAASDTAEHADHAMRAHAT